MAIRQDIRGIKPLNSYAAKRCPVRIQLDIIRPTEPLEASAEAEFRKNAGIEFEHDVVDELAKLARPDWVFVDEPLGSDIATGQTLDAIEEDAPVIVGAVLPTDQEQKRSGRPDLLVFFDGGYIPIDIKHHHSLEGNSSSAVVISEFSSPYPDAATEETGVRSRRDKKGKEDAMQLAHYRRMLQQLGLASKSSQAGIIGVERKIVWYDLDEALWRTPAKSGGKRVKLRTTMETYDFEFDFRCDVAAIATRNKEGTDQELLPPVTCDQCPECPWRDHCGEQLRAGSGDPSLLPGIGYREWRKLRDNGITDRAGVAALDLPTARLGAGGVNLPSWRKAAVAADPRTTIESLFPARRKQHEVLISEGAATAADVVARIDVATAALGGARFLPDAIRNARAVLGREKVYRLSDDVSVVPRGEIEIDVDMECTEDGVYLWGALVADRNGTRLAEEGYHPFDVWEPLTPRNEQETFLRFWSWLQSILAQAGRSGVAARLFVWHESAEATQMKRIAADDQRLLDEVGQLISSDVWVDLKKVFAHGWTTGDSQSLKKIAPLAGFQWEVSDPGGDISQSYYRKAIDAAAAKKERQGARDWLLTYNEGDVKATYAIRQWLEQDGGKWPPV